MKTFYLKFDDEASAESALKAAYPCCYTDEEGNEVHTYKGGSDCHAVDVIGIIYKETGNTITETDEDGNTYEVPETEAIEGWHVNLAAESLPAELQAYNQPKPKSPARVFAGMA